jgi:hypothetical protein
MIFFVSHRKELKRTHDELTDTIREDKREIKDKIDHEYTGKNVYCACVKIKVLRTRKIKSTAHAQEGD